MKAIETIQDLIEEAKIQTVWWGLCIFSLTYFLTNTSKSMWINLPVAILILLGWRWFNHIERRNVMPAPRQSWEKNIDSLLYFLNKKQLNDSIPPPPSWKNNIDSSVVETAINDFIDKILNDFVINLWYSSITKDKEARGVIMDALGEISVRLKQINILDLLTRDIVNLIGDHFESFRRNYAAIGTDVMETLSFEGRDERLKCHLMSSGELYPALISPESEYKVLQKIVDGIFSVVLGPREANCPLVRTILREIVNCLVIQPLLNLASSERINKAIIINVIKERNIVLHKESQDSPKLKCRVIFNFEKWWSSKTFSVYDIEVTDTENKSWFVKRRYSNFERLHRQLQEIPNYNLHLPSAKQMFSRIRQDFFFFLLCIDLEKYLQDLLSIANVALQNEVMDFVSASSKNYSDNEDIDKRQWWSSGSQHADPPEWMPPKAVGPIVNLVHKVFQLDRGSWYRKPIFWILKRMLPIFMDGAVDDWLLREESRLRKEDTVAHGIRWAQDLLWPNGVFFTRVGDGQEASDKPSSFEQKFEAASKIRNFLLNCAPTELKWLVGAEKYSRCATDIFYFTQSNVCIKQLTFAILELLVQTVFPELQDLLIDIRENSHGRSE